MAAQSDAYSEVNRKWKATVKVLLGVEPAGLSEYCPWISRRGSPKKTLRSSKSGKEVLFAAEDYPESAQVLAFDEVDFAASYPPLSINEVKDLDSLVRAVGERAAFTGNIVLGNSKYVERCANIVDSFYLYDCERLSHCKYMAHSAQSVGSECVFGSSGSGYSSFCIRPSSSIRLGRCLEVSKCDHCSDIFFSHGLVGCRECMFCFSMRNKQYAIGNLVLAPEKYKEIKAKLVSEIAQMLLSDKKLPTIYELAAQAAPDYGPMKAAMRGYPAKPQPKPDMEAIEGAFSETCSIIFGKKLQGMKKCEKWLLEHMRRFENGSSCASAKPLVVPEHTDFLDMPRDRLVSEEEAEYLSDALSMQPQEAESLTMRSVSKAISKIAYFSPEWDVGNLQNIPACQITVDSTDCYRSILTINSKKCGCCFWARDSEHIFGSNEVRWSAFDLKCYRSEKLQRCFECDSCRDCSDCYFCHNCENVHDSMFCFNTKNLKYAIGNVQYGREEYYGVKKHVLEEIAGKLKRDKSFPLSIFNVACGAASQKK